MGRTKLRFLIFIVSILMCTLTGCGQKDQATKVPEDALTKLFTVSDYSLTKIEDKSKSLATVKSTYQKYFTSNAFDSFLADRMATRYAALAEKEDALISVKNVELTKTKEENNRIDYNFHVNLILKHTKTGNETAASQSGQLTVQSNDKETVISRLYIEPENLFK
jgi:hypothetical protein